MVKEDVDNSINKDDKNNINEHERVNIGSCIYILKKLGFVSF